MSEDQNIIIRDLQASNDDDKVNIAVEVENFGDVKYIRYADVKILETSSEKEGMDVDFSYMILDSENKELPDVTDEQESRVKNILEIVFSEVVTSYAKSQAE